MSDEYLAEWRPYKVTAEQLPKLQRKEKEAIDAFYLQNYGYFIGCAKNQYKRNPGMMRRCEYEDVLQDIYANLFDDIIHFDSVQLFNVTLSNSMAYTALGGYWNKQNVQNCAFCSVLETLPFFKIETTLDETTSEDSERTFKDLLPDTNDPHTVWMKERERRRQDIIEIKGEELLRTFLSATFFRRWQEGRMHEEINRELRKHADEILALLRRYGTREEKLQGHIKTEAEYQAELAAKAAYRAWELDHLDELPKERRMQLLKQLRKNERNAAKKAAERAERAARFAWEEAHLHELPIPERKRVQKRLSERRKAAERRASV